MCIVWYLLAYLLITHSIKIVLNVVAADKIRPPHPYRHIFLVEMNIAISEILRHVI